VPGKFNNRPRAAIARLTDPANYLSAAPEMVDPVLASALRGV
jgi:3-carboxy-cis,cis-muconate cycloisomerase